MMEIPKLRLWAKMIDKDHRDDFDSPPQIPLITGTPTTSNKKKKSDDLSSALVDAATIVAKVYSNNTSVTSPLVYVSVV